MADGIYNYLTRPLTDASTKSPATKAKVTVPASTLWSSDSAASNAAAAAGVAKTGGADQLHLSNVTQRLTNEPSFDGSKVAAIKQAIQNGQYPLDPRRIAESFHAIEQMIRE